MKTLIFSIALVFCAVFSQAQITELDEALLRYSPVGHKFANSFSVTVLENYAGEFEKDPLTFMKKNFDVKEFISQVQSEENESYLVSIRSRKGKFQAEFDQGGKLINTNQRFENIVLPRDICHQLYRDHKGWAMVKNVRITKSWNGIVNKDLYRITMKNGKGKKTIKIDARGDIRTAMVSI